MSTLIRFLKDDAGATAIEYGLIVAMISITIITTASNLGSELNNFFTDLNESYPN